MSSFLLSTNTCCGRIFFGLVERPTHTYPRGTKAQSSPSHTLHKDSTLPNMTTWVNLLPRWRFFFFCDMGLDKWLYTCPGNWIILPSMVKIDQIALLGLTRECYPSHQDATVSQDQTRNLAAMSWTLYHRTTQPPLHKLSVSLDPLYLPHDIKWLKMAVNSYWKYP